MLSVCSQLCLLRASASCYCPIVEFQSSGTSNNRNMQLLLPSFGFLGGREQTTWLSPAKWLTRALGEELEEDFIWHQMQINNPLWPFELGITPAAVEEGECCERGELITAAPNEAALTVLVLKAGDEGSEPGTVKRNWFSARLKVTYHV